MKWDFGVLGWFVDLMDWFVDFVVGSGIACGLWLLDRTPLSLLVDKCDCGLDFRSTVEWSEHMDVSTSMFHSVRASD